MGRKQTATGGAAQEGSRDPTEANSKPMKRNHPDVATNTVDTGRRQLLQLATGATLAPFASLPFIRHARAADIDRFTLGVASGCPRPGSIVLWTRLLGADLPERLPVAWELARDEGFRNIAASGVALAEVASAHSVHVDVTGLAPGRWYWYRFGALGGRSSVGPHAHGARRGSEHDAAVRHRLLPALGPWSLRGLAPHGRREPRPRAVPRRLHLRVGAGPGVGQARAHARAAAERQPPCSSTATATLSTRATRRCSACTPLRRGSWSGTTTRWRTTTRTTGATTLARDFLARRAAAYRAYWEHLPLPRASRPRGADMRIFERYDWGASRAHPRARRPPVPRPPGLPAPGPRRLEHRDAARLPGAAAIRGARCSARSRNAGSPTAGAGAHGWNLLAQQTLMARFSWREPRSATARRARRPVLDRRLGRLPGGARAPARQRSSSARPRTWWCSAATCTRTTWPT